MKQNKGCWSWLWELGSKQWCFACAAWVLIKFSFIIDLIFLICNLMFILLVAPPGAGEQNKGPAGQMRGSEERSCPETTGSQVFYGAVDVQWTHMQFAHTTLQWNRCTHPLSSWLCLFVSLYPPSISFIQCALIVFLIRSSAAEYLMFC